MKKLLALLPLIGAFALVGCADNADGSDEPQNEESGEAATLEKNKSEIQSKLEELGANGIEISFEVKENGESKRVGTVGMKGDYLWDYDGDNKSLYKITTTSLETFTYNSENRTFESDGETSWPEEITDPVAYKRDIYSAALVNFTYANRYDGLDGFTKVKDTTFLHRSATEYRYRQGVVGVAYIDYKIVVDKETGMTMYWSIEAGDYAGDSGSGSYEVKSFKTGEQVTVPAHN